MSTYVTFRKVCKHHKIPPQDWHYNGQLNYIEFFNGSRIDLLDVAFKPSDPDFERFGSLEYTGGWIEEAGEVREKGKEVLQTRTGRHMNKEYGIIPKNLYTFNPNKKWLYKIYKAWKAGELPDDTAFIQSLFSDNPYTAKEYGMMLAKLKNKATRERLMHGNWEYDDDKSALFQYDDILDLFSNKADESEEKWLSGDVSRKGRDNMPLFLWKGLKIYKTVVVPDHIRADTVKSSDFVKALLKREQIKVSHAILDEDGVGGGVVDQVGCKGFINGSSPILSQEDEQKKKEDNYFENYGNLKTQCYFKLAELTEKGKIEIDVNGDEVLRQDIIDELGIIKQKDLDKDTAKIYLVSKDDMKSSIGRSPDYADGIMMRMWFLLRQSLDNASDYIV